MKNKQKIVLRSIYGLPIKYVTRGLANHFGGHIELHQDLIHYPKLQRAILNHEAKHTEHSWSIKDLFHDLKDDSLRGHRGVLWRFVLRRPSTWYQFLPLYKREGEWVLDVSLLIGYLGLGGVFLGLIIFIKFILLKLIS